MNRVVVVFLDGVGIGPPDASVNPFLQARLPILRERLGGTIPTLRDHVAEGPGGVAFPLEATLDVEGTPQSGTGQVSLFTGSNAARLFGRHFGPWTPVALRPLLEDENFLRRAVEAGVPTVFANAYPRGFLENRRFRRVGAPPLAAHSAGLLELDHEALAEGRAVASEIVNDGWRRHLGHTELPEPTPREAGRNLGRIAADSRFTFFAHYHTDMAGHRGGMHGAVEALERVDAFLGGALEVLPSGTIVLGVSDHGNIEDVRVGHTRNPALGFVLASGPLPGRDALPARLTDVAPWILNRVLSSHPPAPADPADSQV